MRVTPRLQQVVRRYDEIRTAGEPCPAVRRLIVVRDDRLGDLVLSLPAVEALRRTYPQARLALMVRPDLAPLARMVEGVDRVLPAHADRGELGSEIERFGADLIVCISRGAAIARAAATAGIEHRVGTGFRIYSPLFTRTVSERRRHGGRHELEYALSFAHRAGAAAGEARVPLVIPDAADAAPRDAFVLLHPGSGGSCPRWPVERFVELAEQLHGDGLQVVFSIGPEDAACEQALAAAPAAVRSLPRFSEGIELLPGLLQSAALVVSNSTGPLHLAAALGRPTLGLFAPWSSCSPVRWGPYAANGWALTAVSERAERWSRADRRKRGEQLLGQVGAETVAHCVRAIAAGRAPELPTGG